MSQVIIEHHGYQIQCDMQEYLKHYYREGWYFVTRATPLFDLGDMQPAPAHQPEPDLEALNSRQGKLL